MCWFLCYIPNISFYRKAKIVLILKVISIFPVLASDFFYLHPSPYVSFGLPAGSAKLLMQILPSPRSKSSDFIIRVWPCRSAAPAGAEQNTSTRCFLLVGPAPPRCSDSSSIWYWQPLQFPSSHYSCKYKFQNISKSWQNETWGIGKMGLVYELWSCPCNKKHYQQAFSSWTTLMLFVFLWALL